MRTAFLAQSSLSNYCAVYATAMLASAAGVATDRRRALREFGLARTNPSFAGASRRQVLDVFRRMVRPGFSRWLSWPRVDLAGLTTSARAQIASTGVPALVCFRVIHRRSGFRCMHATLVVSAGARLLLLDPLARKPPVGQGHNAEIDLDDESSGMLAVRGTCYAVDLHGPASLLEWHGREAGSAS